MKLKKYEGNPILKPLAKNDWESLCVLNPAVYYKDGVFKMLYRAAGPDMEHIIRLGLAESTDGFHFTRVQDTPVLSPDANGADAGGIEDPRLVYMGGLYYLTYAARPYAPGQYWAADWKPMYTPTQCGPHFTQANNTLTHLAISEDLHTFKKLGRITDSRLDNRDVLIFPRRVNGKYVMLTRPMEWAGEGYGCDVPSIWISFSDDLQEWTEHTLFAKPETWWEDKKLGASCPPIRTDKGWFFLYHGVASRDDAYRVGAMLLDLEHPEKIIARTKDFIMEPEFDYETSGYYNGCVFPTGNVVVDGTLYVYYGAADRYCCVATADFDALVDELYTNCRVEG